MNSKGPIRSDIHPVKRRKERSSSKTTSKIVKFFTKVHDIVNHNSSIQSVNNITSAFEYMVNSPGWKALNTFANTMGALSNVYKAIGNNIGRAEAIIIAKEEFKQQIRKDDEQKEMDRIFYEELRSILDRVVELLMSVNKRLRCRLVWEKKISRTITRKQRRLTCPSRRRRQMPESCPRKSR